MFNFSTFIKSIWWQLALFAVAIILIKLLFEVIIPDLIHNRKKHKRFLLGSKWREDRDLTIWLRGLKPKEFEEYISSLFDRLGFKTETVGKSHDGGIDVIAEKDGIKNYIQCKKYITSQVPVGAVRDFYGAIVDRVTNGKGYFITTNKFTLEAEKYAEDKPIELVDSFKLVKYIRIAEKNGKIVAEKESNPKRCPECNSGLIERSGKYGKFFGCSNYPKCTYTEKIND